jgi:hypothetical protein
LALREDSMQPPIMGTKEHCVCVCTKSDGDLI